MGRLRQGILEMSNVSIAEEMVTMIVAQRAYEINSKAIQTSDNMLGIANNLKGNKIKKKIIYFYFIFSQQAQL